MLLDRVFNSMYDQLRYEYRLLKYGNPEGTFPFQYLAEKKFNTMLFKQDLNVKKRHNKSFKRHIM